jgi:hypothetical protein
MNSDILYNKRVLLFVNNLFGYEYEIKSKLEELGAIVDHFNERPSNSFLSKVLIRLNRNILGFYIDRYYRKIYKQTIHNNYNYVIVIKGESISISILTMFKTKHRNAKFVLYLWDSIKNNRNAISNYKYFDKVLSFDTNDVNEYGFMFRPLFYVDSYKSIVPVKNSIYDALFVGTTHSDRYNFVKKIEKQLLDNNRKIYCYFFLRNGIFYYINKFTKKTYQKAKKTDFHFKSLDKKILLYLIANSKCIIDIQHPNQIGLTIRTIEALGANKKLITTNTSIINYDFYNSNNILLVDRKSPIIDDSFFDSPFQAVNDEIYNKYSINTWIFDLIK